MNLEKELSQFRDITKIAIEENKARAGFGNK
jgi:hypothetical protein